ncbi:MAG: glycosyltransferase [Flavisolibacter sp.]
MQGNLAPIVLFVYNRPEHTLRTLEALKQNILASESALYIFCDGPKKNATKNDLDKIDLVRFVVRREMWCKKVIINEKLENSGLSISIISGVTDLINQFGKVIVIEDDLITHTGFLRYCNDGLNYYKEDSKVYGISGYAFASDETFSDTYLLPIGSSWGWATWKEKWLIFNPDSQQLLEEIKQRGLKERFDFGYYPFFKMLEDNTKGFNDSWAIRYYASFFLMGGYFLFPKYTLVRNMGFDNTGVHSGDNIVFDQQFKEKNIVVGEIKASNRPLKIMKKYFKSKFKQSRFKRLSNYFKW